MVQIRERSGASLRVYNLGQWVLHEISSIKVFAIEETTTFGVIERGEARPKLTQVLPWLDII